MVVRGAGLAGAGFALAQVLTLSFYLVLARLATPDDFGVFAAGSILVGIGTLFAEAGLMSALIQRRDRIEEAASTAVAATLVGGLALSLLALALAPLVGLYFERTGVTQVAAAMSGWLLLQAATVVPDALMQRRFSFIRRLAVEPAGVVTFGITAVVACSHGLGVWGLVLGTYALGVTQVALAWGLVGWRPSARLVSYEMWRELLAFGRHVMSSEFIRRVAAELDAALVGRFIGTAPLGQYRYARRFAIQPLAGVVNIASYVLLPALAQLSGERERFRPAFLRALRWTSTIALPTSFAFLPLGEPVAVLLLGERWREAGQALSALCAYSAGGAVVSVASEGLKAWGRPDFLPRIHLFAAILAAALMLALLPVGLVGIAAGVSIASAAAAVYALRVVGRAIDIPLRGMLAEIWPPFVAAALSAATLYPAERLLVHASERGTVVGLALLAAEALLGAALYLALLAAAAPASARELLAVTSAAWRRLRRSGGR